MSESERAREALVEFRSGIAAQISREDVETRRALADAYAEMGLLAEAIEELEKVLAVAPDNAPAAMLLGRLRGRIRKG